MSTSYGEKNPFAGMQVEGDESSKGITEEEKAEMQSVIDTDGDGVVSSEELDSAVDKLTEIESEMTFTDSKPVSATAITLKELDVSKDPITDTEKPFQGGVGGTMEEMKQREEEHDSKALDYPSVASLTKLIPPSQDAANMSHQQDWARHCIKFADANNVHFLGLSLKTGEPMFKEKK